MGQIFKKERKETKKIQFFSEVFSSPVLSQNRQFAIIIDFLFVGGGKKIQSLK